mgnify:CR=1 FL=1
MTDLHRPWLEQGLQVGWYLDWQGQTYRIRAFDATKLVLHLEQLVTNEVQLVALETLLLPIADDSVPLFAPSLPALEHKRRRQRPAFTSAPADDLPVALLQRADRLIHLVETVESRVESLLAAAHLCGDTLLRKGALEHAFGELDEPVSHATYYRSLACYRTHSGDRGRIAASFHRRSFNQTRMKTAQQHFVDTLILRFYARQPPIRPSTLYKLALSAWKRTGGQWLDPQRCPVDIPQDLVAELLNPAVPLTHITDTPDKRRLLTAIDLPSRSWWYAYLRWFEQQPEQGKQVMTARYGKDMWEREQLVFDTFVTRAAFPLHYVFADHWLLDVFVVDEATRSQPVRLWLTVLLDAYSRCVLGMTLLPEAPCIESIQQALQHALWPKTSHRNFGLEQDWVCYGIPQQLSLDNAWAHHSHSLENLARVLGQGGEYPSMDLLFRPPYKGRYGALVERFFGNLSQRVKQHLPGAIQSSHPRDVRQAARDARLLYTDVDRILHRLVLDYQHTPHAELKGQTPHERWLDGMAWTAALVPPQTPALQRLFWRLSPRTRVLTTKGIHAFGMTYWSPDLQRAARVTLQGERLRYRFRYDPHDLSRIALFHESDWVGDLEAKELRQADGSLRALSVWEHAVGHQAARAAGAPENHWLSFVHEVETLSQQRLREQKRARRPSSAAPSASDAHTTETALETVNTAQTYADYTRLLTQFMQGDGQ